MEEIGTVFTPPRWARFAVETAGLVEPWLAGGTVLDPTMGTGNLLVALVDAAIDAGHAPDEAALRRLRGIELVPGYRDQAVERFRYRFGVDLSRELRCGDFFELAPEPCSAVIGNPPWINFTDLPETLKARYKERFLASGLVDDARHLLLGRSRIDLAALVVQTVFARHLNPGGEAWFFLPLSVLFNDGAHRVFQRFSTERGRFGPTSVHDFGAGGFDEVSTRHGLVGFRGCSPAIPVPYHRMHGEGWTRSWISPFSPGGPWGVHESPEVRWLASSIAVDRRSLPRQGLNTGGANDVFLFDRCEPEEDGVCLCGDDRLPSAFVHPLLTRRSFDDASAPPERWVLVPHGADGKPLSPEAVAQVPLLAAYLEKHRERLAARKGALLRRWRDQNIWWALVGVGPYSFAPYKVVWEALGRRAFRPVVRSGLWQVNQALQAYLPCWSEDEAVRLQAELARPEIEAQLRASTMAGTMSWAQPGRIRALLKVR